MQKIFKNILTALFLSHFWDTAHGVILYYDESRAGEASMVRGIKKALEAGNQNLSIELVAIKKATQGQDIENFTKTLDQREPDSLVTFGRLGIDFLSKHGKFLQEKGWRLYNVAHQIFESHKAIYPLVTNLFIPAYVQEAPELLKAWFPTQEKFVWTNGVASDLSAQGIIDEVKKEYTTHQARFPKASSYLAVILAGDTEHLNGSIVPYQAEEVHNLTPLVTHLRGTKESHILVVNGPRTGAYDPENGTHKISSLDPVTQAFNRDLEAAGLQEGKDFTLFNFQFGTPSLYKATLGLMLGQEGQVLVPGESNSYIEDILSLSLEKGDKAFVYLHSAMNPMNHANVLYVHKNKGVSYFDKDFTLVPAKDPSSSKDRSASANDQIAAVLLE